MATSSRRRIPEMAKRDVIGQSLNLPELQPRSMISDLSPKIQTDDYEFARSNLYDLINKGSLALEDIIDVAKQSESPRAFEVVTNLLKTMVDANKDLLDLAKKQKELEKRDENPDAPKTVNNNLILTSAELLKMIKSNE
mgnify:CR=1 FL=1